MSTQAQINSFFTPTQISGCQLWLDGADPAGYGVIPANGATVSTWADKSGNARNVTGSGTPTFLSGGGINFNGTNAFYTNTNFAYNLSTRSVFLVAKVNTYKQYAGLITFIPNPTSDVDQNSITGMSVETAANTSLSFNQYLGGPAPVYMSVLTASLTNVNLYNDNMNGTIGTGFVNGNTITNITTATIAGTTSGFGVGTRWQGSMSLSYLFTGAIYEIILYSGPLSTTQRQQVEGYLAWKWGLQSSLPSTHPYKNSLIPPLLNPPRALPAMLQNPTATFLPTQISGCQLWLDAADPTGTGTLPVGGSTLATWKDKSPNGFTGTAFNSPTVQANILNGLPVIRFNGTNQYIDFGNILNLGTNGLSMFAVTKFAKPPDTIDNGGWIVGKTSYRGNYGRWGMGYDGYYSSGMTAYYEEVTTFVGPSFPFNPSTQFNLFSSQTNRTSFSRILLNGTLGAQSDFSLIPTNMSNTDSLFVASYGNSTGIAPLLTYNLNGDIAEILVYFATLTDAQRQQIEGYLAWKWGIQANLPTNHPYKVGPPYSAIFTAPSRSLGIAATWNPRQISGCQLWLDAADVNGNRTNPLNGASVSTWTDKSGNGRNAVGLTGTGTYSSTGFNSRQTIQITSSGNMVSPMAAGTLSTGFAIFVVFQKTGGDNTYDTLVSRTLGNLPAPFDMYSYNGPFTTRLIGNGTNYRDLAEAQTIFRTTTPTIYFINLASSTPATWNESVNGTASTYSIVTIQNGTGAYGDNATLFYLGTRADNVTKMTGNISEVIVYSVSSFTTAQRQNVEGYLAWKWGLVASLPANHPFKRWPPPP
jgi:hypothetical protein